ncbi:MAG: helix-turn-helix domain-containing protein, partial [Mobilitalea sp.]
MVIIMTDINQIIGASSQAPIQVYIKTHNKSDRHWHRTVELDYILSGHMEIQVKEQTYYLEKDQLILINSYDIHSIRNDDCILAVLEIDLSKYDNKLVNEALLRFDCNCSTRQDQELFTPLKGLMARFIQANSVEDEYNEILNKSLSYAILHYLMKMFLAEPVTDYVTQRNQISRMEDILKYINQQYMENLTLQDLATKFYLTVPYMSKIFKDYIGTNFTDYRNSIRLSHAISEIGKPSVTIDMLAEKSGFPNTRSFVSAFKEAYGELPSQYRKALLLQKQPVTNISRGDVETDVLQHRYLAELSKYLDSPEQGNMPLPVHVIEIAPIAASQKGYHLKHNFRNTTTIGRAKDILYAENQVMLREIQKDIGFKYIKFHGILDDDMMVYSELEDGTPQIAFTYIDMVIDFLLSINLKPIVQLSFMPRALAKDITYLQFYRKSIISLPKDLSKWTYLIRELILHLESRYSSEEVEKWLFSLWNEPDSPREMFGIGTLAQYFDFYKATFQVVKSCNPNLVFGSPSILPSNMKSGNWITEFLTLCKESDCSPAFLNFHFYPIAESPEALPADIQTYPHMLYMKSPDALRECIFSLKANAKQYHWGIETVYLTEWNSSISYRELLNDTSYSPLLLQLC